MKKLISLTALLLVAVFILSGCSSPPPPVEEPTAAPTETPIPTQPPVTPEPTVSPRPMEGNVEWPEANATLIEIDPIDKPTRPPITFEPYRTYVSQNLGVSFDIPAYWGDPTNDIPNSSYIVFQEPATDIRSGTGVPAFVTVAVNTGANEQTEKDAQNYLDTYLTTLRDQYPTLETSKQSENTMMGQKGSYVSYWVWIPIDENNPENTMRMRGRCVVIPSGNRLYNVRTLFPIDFNTEYDEAVFKVIRSTFAEV